MSAPERIWTTEPPTDLSYGRCHVHAFTGATEYILATPGALAASPEGQALIGAVIEEAASSISVFSDTARRTIRALRLDALTALAARDARMRAEGMERAAEMARQRGLSHKLSSGSDRADSREIWVRQNECFCLAEGIRAAAKDAQEGGA